MSKASRMARIDYEVQAYINRKKKADKAQNKSLPAKTIPINGTPVKSYGSLYPKRDYWKYTPPVFRPEMK